MLSPPLSTYSVSGAARAGARPAPLLRVTPTPPQLRIVIAGGRGGKRRGGGRRAVSRIPGRSEAASASRLPARERVVRRVATRRAEIAPSIRRRQVGRDRLQMDDGRARHADALAKRLVLLDAVGRRGLTSAEKRLVRGIRTGSRILEVRRDRLAQDRREERHRCVRQHAPGRAVVYVP